jgi:integrase
MQNYRHGIEEHLLPAFEATAVADILKVDITAWEKRERAAGYAESSMRFWRRLLHLILADAVDEGLLESNPAAQRRGRGRRMGRSQHRGAEKVITTALGVLLIAERAALLSGRDDEFVAIALMGFTGMRWGEVVGLEAEYIRSNAVRVEWQLYELDNGDFYRCPPKDDSQRTVAAPAWLVALAKDHLARASPMSCSCHGRRYAFSGHRSANHAARRPGPRLADVAVSAGVSVATVSAALNRPTSVADLTRVKVETAVADLGYKLGAATSVLAPHWRRNGFATWIFQPAVTGWYPKKAPSPTRPVPVLADLWPGVPIRGRNAAGRADSCWVPIASGLTPHGLRHTYKTIMIELGTPATLMDAQMGHADGSVQGRYAHVTPAMTQRLLNGLSELWENALAERRSLSPGSPVAVLDRLLRQPSDAKPLSQISPRVV